MSIDLPEDNQEAALLSRDFEVGPLFLVQHINHSTTWNAISVMLILVQCSCHAELIARWFLLYFYPSRPPVGTPNWPLGPFSLSSFLLGKRFMGSFLLSHVYRERFVYFRPLYTALSAPLGASQAEWCYFWICSPQGYHNLSMSRMWCGRDQQETFHESAKSKD